MPSIKPTPQLFAQYLNSQGLSFGLVDQLLEFIGAQTEAGQSCASSLDHSRLIQAGLGPKHLLKIRRAWRRYRAGSHQVDDKSTGFINQIDLAARRWAHRHATGQDQSENLERAFAATASAILKHGRLRIHLKRPEDPRAEQVAMLTEHTEGCNDIPPHRWFTVVRGVSDGLLWMEVQCPEGEAEKRLGDLSRPGLVEDLQRSVAKPVLDLIGERSERQAISTSADSLYALIRKPPIQEPVAGVATDGKHVFIKVVGGSQSGNQAEFPVRDIKGIQAWLGRQKVTYAAVARLGRTSGVSLLLQTLTNAGLTAEPVREAGLMKQAKQIPNSIKFAAAEVAARRFQDPLKGYAGIEPDQLGLGEYLDQVDHEQLRAALKDARDTVAWERSRGKPAGPVARGVSPNIMIKEIDDLRPGMELTGTVANITHFGAFIEMGFPTQGLAHLSELADRHVEHPSEVVQVGDRVRVRVLEVDWQRNRISLSMRAPRSARRESSRDKRAKAVDALDRLFNK